MFNLHFASVTKSDETLDKFDGISIITDTDRDRFNLPNVGAKSLHKRTHGRDDHRWSALRFLEPPQNPRPASHGVNRGTHSLKRERLPCWEELDFIGADKGGEIMNKTFGFGRRRDGHNNWATARSIDQ